jgi:hypothetical protein
MAGNKIGSLCFSPGDVGMCSKDDCRLKLRLISSTFLFKLILTYFCVRNDQNFSVEASQAPVPINAMFRLIKSLPHIYSPKEKRMFKIFLSWTEKKLIRVAFLYFRVLQFMPFN